jgi:hypothetical protein
MIMLRWLVFVPVAFVLGSLSTFIVVAPVLFFDNPPGWLPQVGIPVVRVASSALGGVVFVWAGGLVAPTHRRGVGMALLLLLTLLAGFGMPPMLEAHAWLELATMAASAVGGALGFWMLGDMVDAD